MKKGKQITFYNPRKFSDEHIQRQSFAFGNGDDFKIYKIEDVLPYIQFPIPIHRNNYFEILFVTDGSAAIRHKGLIEYGITKGQIYFKAPHQITSGDISGRDTKGYICLLDKNFILNNGKGFLKLLELPFFSDYNNSQLSLEKHQAKKFKVIFDMIYTKWVSNSSKKNEIVSSFIAVLLLELDEIYTLQCEFTDRKKSPGELITSKYLNLVAEHFIKRQKVKDYASLLFVTPNYLNKIIKELTSKTASFFIQEMILLEAKVLLKQTENNISQIALALNFEDTSYFTRFFRKHTGITPLNYRKKE